MTNGSGRQRRPATLGIPGPAARILPASMGRSLSLSPIKPLPLSPAHVCDSHFRVDYAVLESLFRQSVDYFVFFLAQFSAITDFVIFDL